MCKTGNKFFGPILAWWHHRMADRLFILCPAGRVDGVNRLSGTKNGLQAVICSLICKIGKKFLGPIFAWWHLSYSIQSVSTVSRGTRGWGEWTFRSSKQPAGCNMQSHL